MNSNATLAPCNFNQAFVVGLVFACPIGRASAECRLRSIRMMDVRDRIAWVKGLTPEECGSIQAVHAECLRKRESANQGYSAA